MSYTWGRWFYCLPYFWKVVIYVKDVTKAKCKKAVEYMIEYKKGMKVACENFSISTGSLHSYIHNILKYEDDEKYNIVVADMRERYSGRW